MTAIEKMAGNSGFEVITGAVTGKNYEALVVNSDAVFTVLEIDSVNVLTTSGIGSNTIKAGAYLPATAGSRITKVTITSGIVIGY